MRSLIFELRPESLERDGVVAALERQAQALRARHQLAVTMTTAEPDAPVEVKEAAYRIAQEALHNVVKHARATVVRLTLDTRDSRITLSMTDNGDGFDAGASYPGHLGLRSMQERAERLGGALTIDSASGRRTTVTATLPAR